MYHPSDRSYLQTKAIKEGSIRLDPEQQDLVSWISAHEHVRVLNFYFYTVETAQHFRQQHIVVIVERSVEKEKADQSPDRAVLISKFHDYFDQYGPSRKDPLKRDIFPRTHTGYPETILGICALEDVELIAAYTYAAEAITRLAATYDEIWMISKNGIEYTIFFYTSDQLQVCEMNGVSQAIREDILLLLKQHDPFGYFGPQALKYVRFDSKEVLDQNYSGEIYRYYK